MRASLVRFGFTTLVLTTLGACVDAASDDPAAPDDGPAGGKAEEWDTDNRPSGFGVKLEYAVTALPRAGEAARIPWAGHYWPIYKDGPNHRWAGTSSKSPTEKYAAAFGVTGVEDAVSKAVGIDAHPGARCTTTAQCDDGTVCAKRRGASSGRCIATWEGLCHAWSPAAIMLPEPKRAVTYNGVTFKVQDLKALATLLYDDTSSKSVSLRCEDDASDIPLDADGRPTVRACEDANAGTWHVLATNFLGLRQQAFVYDRTWDDEVWNQPLRGYEITRHDTITATEANRLIGQPGATYTTNPRAAKLYRVHMDVSYISESPPTTDGNLSARIDSYTVVDGLDYVLEADAAGKVIGGEWVGASRTDHPDFLWLPTRRNGATVGKVSWTQVKTLLDLAQ